MRLHNRGFHTPAPDGHKRLLDAGRRVVRIVGQTITGSALTRTSFPGAAQLYADLATGTNPVFCVSSSPGNLYGFMVASVRRHGFPKGLVLLGASAGHELTFVRATDSDAYAGHATTLSLL